MGGTRGAPWTGRQSIPGQIRHRQDKQPRTHSFVPKGNLEKPITLTVMFLDCGRKPEYLVRTHACTGRTCKLHAERPPARGRTQVAARQQCYQLRHRAALNLTSLVKIIPKNPVYEGHLFHLLTAVVCFNSVLI
ncbi:hypothetical protein AMECASPLE_001549 [Ameca splendens]|uniref:Uncharacterized protein n=1 Tax=Ameca splendens TaxID=208324 RepID=A0ABV0Z6V9_9TELE